MVQSDDLLTKANQLFTDCALKDWENINEQEEVILRDRVRLLDKQFVFTPEAIECIRIINTKLKTAEDRIRKHAKQLHQFMNKWKDEKVIDDYEIFVQLCLFNDNYYKQWNEELDGGNPFYSDRTLLLYEHDTDGSLYNDNWNEYDPKHPLANEFICYTLHHILYHTQYLAMEDILRIDDVWIELEAWHQYLIEIK